MLCKETKHKILLPLLESKKTLAEIVNFVYPSNEKTADIMMKRASNWYRKGSKTAYLNQLMSDGIIISDKRYRGKTFDINWYKLMEYLDIEHDNLIHTMNPMREDMFGMSKIKFITDRNPDISLKGLINTCVILWFMTLVKKHKYNEKEEKKRKPLELMKIPLQPVKKRIERLERENKNLIENSMTILNKLYNPEQIKKLEKDSVKNISLYGFDYGTKRICIEIIKDYFDSISKFAGTGWYGSLLTDGVPITVKMNKIISMSMKNRNDIKKIKARGIKIPKFNIEDQLPYEIELKELLQFKDSIENLFNIFR